MLSLCCLRLAVVGAFTSAVFPTLCCVVLFSLYCLCVVLQCFPYCVVVVVLLRRKEEGGGKRKRGAGSAATKTNTPQDNVGKNINLNI